MASNFGRIIRKERNFLGVSRSGKEFINVIPQKELILSTDKDGYLKTAFRYEGKRYYRRVHRIIAETYIPNPYGYPVVNHKNGVKDDNRVENLEWCTVSENTQHAFDVLGRAGTNGGMNKRCALLDSFGEIIQEYSSLKEAGIANNVSQVAIINSINENRECKGKKYILINEDATTIERVDLCREDIFRVTE